LTVKNDRTVWALLKTKPFVISLRVKPQFLLRTHRLNVNIVLDAPERDYPVVQQDTQKLFDYSFAEVSHGLISIKASIHIVSRAFQSTPFRIAISTTPLENLPIHQQIHFRLLSDPIFVISRLKSNNQKTNTAFSANANPNQQQPSLLSIAGSIHKMMGMLEIQNKMLQTVSSKMPVETELYHKKKRIDYAEDVAKKIGQIDSVAGSNHLGQEPLQAGLQNLITQYKEVPKEKKQKRLRQLLCDLTLEDQHLLREFAEDVLEIQNNPALQPNPDDEMNPKDVLEQILFSQNGFDTFFDKHDKYKFF